VVDFRSDWVLCFRIEQSLPGASDEPLGATGVFCAMQKQSANVAAATGVYSVRKRSATKRQRQQDVDHEALSQDVMLLAFVPLSF